MRTFKDYLTEQLKDPEFRKLYEQEKEFLRLSLKIIELRKNKGLTQKELAQLMRTSQQAISRMENGNYEKMTITTLQKLAEVTGMLLEVNFKPVPSTSE